ncbi:LPKTxAVK-anchored surface protein [uncultured Gemella sp.]|uniref:LPKTxAVK-anchored surface protein n=1 Tax=uncultured Gemella sp. TaxID=254352 RepID=UPI0028D2A94E|nr:LPKTxAVK-anchored surface protein [uncultured Gemella sp.]
MKKQVLLSVFAASLFAAPVALANGELGANRTTETAGFYADTTKEATVGEIKAENDKDLGRVAEELTRGANKLKNGENLKVDKGEAVKAPAAKAGQKTLPKTHAVK